MPGTLLGNEEALLVAHELLGITKAAFADFPVKEGQLKNDANLQAIFSVTALQGTAGFENMYKVVQMELSLMYDVLYTKAAVIHTRFGYFIRIVSPIITASVTLLFWLYNKEGQRIADIIITYILLVVTFVLDVKGLLGAAASTWTYSFFNARSACCLHRQVCRTGKWQELRRFVVSLDPWQLPLREHGGGYRLWSGTMGQYNLLSEATHGTTNPFSGWLNTFGLDDAWMESRHSRRLDLGHDTSVKELLFNKIRNILNMDPVLPQYYPQEEDAWAAEERRRRELEEQLGFLPEFQELILIWHVATDVFLRSSEEQLRPPDQERSRLLAKMVKAVSDYMAFLAAIRPDMLPGPKLRSKHKKIRKDLEDILQKSSNRTIPIYGTKAGENSLVRELQNMEHARRLRKSSIILSDGVRLANLLLSNRVLNSTDDWRQLLNQVGTHSMKIYLSLVEELGRLSTRSSNMEMLELILQIWVRQLIFASIRCARGSHAKQLGRGCELTTIVWILYRSTPAYLHLSRPR